MEATQVKTEDERRRTLRRVVAAGGLGTLIEYLDYASYSYLATVIAVVFFPSEDPTVSLLNTFAIFALSFVVRPIGAFVWGSLGDRIGRKRVLATTIILMSGSTFLIGIIPSYATIGLFAPALLLLLRMIQSFSASGEYAGAGIYIAEFSPNRSRGFLTSVVPMAASAGFLLASGMSTVLFTVLPSDAMESWGWRLPFLIAGPLGAVGLYLRFRLEETPYFKEVMDRYAQDRRANDAAKELQRKRDRFRASVPGMIRLLCVMALNAGAYYLLLSYTPTYLVEEAGMPQAQASLVVTIALVVYTVMIPVTAALSDRIGRKRALLGACIAFIVLSYPIMIVLSSGSFVVALVVLIVALLLFSFNDAVFPSFFAETFATRSRYLGFALPFNIGAVVFGGVAPYIATWLIAKTGNSHSPAFFLIAIAVVSLIGVLLSKETAKVDMPTSTDDD